MYPAACGPLAVLRAKLTRLLFWHVRLGHGLWGYASQCGDGLVVAPHHGPALSLVAVVEVEADTCEPAYPVVEEQGYMDVAASKGEVMAVLLLDGGD